MRTLHDYLKEIGMKVTIEPPSPLSVSRIAQLTQKTNQFNLTTKRYQQEEIEKLSSDANCLMYTARVEDKFGDNGMTGLTIVIKEGKKWIIDTFLLSCRVIGRRVEETLIYTVLEEARRFNVEEIQGSFRATDRNGLCRDFYKKMGFHINKSFPCGSLRLGISQLKSQDITKKYDICLLSNYKKKDGIQKCAITKEISENNMLLDKYLKDYCQNNDKSIVIAIRSKSDEEINYYKSIFGNDVNLTTGQVKSYSSYKASSESKVTVAYQSTLLLEMLAIKNKVLHIDFTDNKNLFDYDSPIKYKFISFDDMQDKINAIHSMNIDDYIKMTKNQQEYVMNYNSNNPPHKVINNQINSIINTKNYVS